MSVTEFTTEQIHAQYAEKYRIWREQSAFDFRAGGVERLPKYEDEKHEQSEEDCNIVHCAQHDNELAAQIREKPHQLENPQKTESSQHRYATAFHFNAMEEPIVDLK